MTGMRVNPRITMNPKKEGAVITIEGFEIEVTVRPQWKTPDSNALMDDEGQLVESLRMDLGPYLTDLEITETPEGITVKPKRFLGRDFPPIAEIVEFYGGSYVSSGRESRFTIPYMEQNKKDSPIEDQ